MKHLWPVCTSYCRPPNVAFKNTLFVCYLLCMGINALRELMRAVFINFWGAKGAPILFSEIGFCVASCSCIYIYIYIYIYIMYISVKMAAPWGSLTLLSYYSLCPHLRSH